MKKIVEGITFDFYRGFSDDEIFTFQFDFEIDEDILSEVLFIESLLISAAKAYLGDRGYQITDYGLIDALMEACSTKLKVLDARLKGYSSKQSTISFIYRDEHVFIHGLPYALPGFPKQLMDEYINNPEKEDVLTFINNLREEINDMGKKRKKDKNYGEINLTRKISILNNAEISVITEVDLIVSFSITTAEKKLPVTTMPNEHIVLLLVKTLCDMHILGANDLRDILFRSYDFKYTSPLEPMFPFAESSKAFKSLKAKWQERSPYLDSLNIKIKDIKTMRAATSGYSIIYDYADDGCHMRTFGKDTWELLDDVVVTEKQRRNQLFPIPEDNNINEEKCDMKEQCNTTSKDMQLVKSISVINNSTDHKETCTDLIQADLEVLYTIKTMPKTQTSYPFISVFDTLIANKLCDMHILNIKDPKDMLCRTYHTMYFASKRMEDRDGKYYQLAKFVIPEEFRSTDIEINNVRVIQAKTSSCLLTYKYHGSIYDDDNHCVMSIQNLSTNMPMGSFSMNDEEIQNQLFPSLKNDDLYCIYIELDGKEQLYHNNVKLTKKQIEDLHKLFYDSTVTDLILPKECTRFAIKQGCRVITEYIRREESTSTESDAQKDALDTEISPEEADKFIDLGDHIERARLYRLKAPKCFSFDPLWPTVEIGTKPEREVTEKEVSKLERELPSGENVVIVSEKLPNGRISKLVTINDNLYFSNRRDDQDPKYYFTYDDSGAMAHLSCNSPFKYPQEIMEDARGILDGIYTETGWFSKGKRPGEVKTKMISMDIEGVKLVRAISIYDDEKTVISITPKQMVIYNPTKTKVIKILSMYDALCKLHTPELLDK